MLPTVALFPSLHAAPLLGALAGDAESNDAGFIAAFTACLGAAPALTTEEVPAADQGALANPDTPLDAAPVILFPGPVTFPLPLAAVDSMADAGWPAAATASTAIDDATAKDWATATEDLAGPWTAGGWQTTVVLGNVPGTAVADGAQGGSGPEAAAQPGLAPNLPARWAGLTQTIGNEPDIDTQADQLVTGQTVTPTESDRALEAATDSPRPALPAKPEGQPLDSASLREGLEHQTGAQGGSAQHDPAAAKAPPIAPVQIPALARTTQPPAPRKDEPTGTRADQPDVAHLPLMPPDPTNAAPVHPLAEDRMEPAETPLQHNLRASSRDADMPPPAAPAGLEAKPQGMPALTGSPVDYVGAAPAFEAKAGPARSPETTRAILRQITAATPDQDGAIEIALFPKGLGTVRLDIQQGPEGARVVVMADRPETLDLIRHHSAALAAELRGAGLTNPVISFAPDFGQPAFGTGRPDTPDGSAGFAAGGTSGATTGGTSQNADGSPKGQPPTSHTAAHDAGPEQAAPTPTPYRREPAPQGGMILRL